MKKLSLRAQLLLAGIVLTTVPLLIVGLLTTIQKFETKKLVSVECERVAYNDLDHMAENIYAMCEIEQQMIQKQVDSALNVCRDILSKAGGISQADEPVDWTAVNQYTKVAQQVSLPKMKMGDLWLGQNSSLSIESPLVDHLQQLMGGTCTLFQRMNDAGDMLRISTNVEKLDGTRAIGTYIPCQNPDGAPNPVVATLLRGETFEGRAFVVNQWYITAYAPIFDADHNVIGAVYVGVPQENAVELRQAIMDIVVGKTGYVFVLDSEGNYVISQEGKRDGENIMGAKDSSGREFVRSICETATKLNREEIGEERYSWKNSENEPAREKITRLKYFAAWDWVIGVGSYSDEFYEAADHVEHEANKAELMLLSITVLSLAIAVVVWVFMSGRLSKKLTLTINDLTHGAQQVSAASSQVASAAQSLAEGASEQAASLEESSSSLEEMSAMTKQNAANALQANALAVEAKQAADTGVDFMTEMNAAIQSIQSSSDETAKIIKVIDEIAFQTNLLALNAAVEAARAGEAGKGFAVVAEEVRNLAKRSAEAARNTSEMIADSVANAKNGVQIATSVGSALDDIVSAVNKTTELVDEITAASQEQSQGIGEISGAIAQMDTLTQSNAANAEESASASEEMRSQAESMTQVVMDLQALVSGMAQ
jgi:hypothetical protein